MFSANVQKSAKSSKSSKTAQNVKKGSRNQEHVDVAKKKAPENPCPVARRAQPSPAQPAVAVAVTGS